LANQTVIKLTVTHEPRLLFIINYDFGSLGEALYFLKGNPFNASLLLPQNLFELNKDKLDYPLYLYHTIHDIEQVVARVMPQIVMLYSGYLFVIDGIMSHQDFERSLNYLHSQGMILATSDPFLNWYSAIDSAKIRKESFYSKFTDYSRAIHRLLKKFIHITPLELQVKADLKALSFYNKNGLLTPQERADCRSTAYQYLNIEDSRQFWLFYLATTEYDNQINSEGKRYGPHARYFHAIIRDKLNETVDNGRVAVFIAPAKCINALKDLPDLNREHIIFISFCDFDLYCTLILAAEYVFSWNIFSFSLFLRVLNRLPVFFFARGHLSANIPGIFKHFGAHFPHCRISALNPRRRLDIKKLQLLAQQQNRLLFEPFCRNLRKLNSPRQTIQEILKLKDGVKR
jgi:hypothetical protein